MFFFFVLFVIWLVYFVPPDSDEFLAYYNIACRKFEGSRLAFVSGYDIGCENFKVKLFGYEYTKSYSYLGLSSILLYSPFYSLFHNIESHYFYGLFVLQVPSVYIKNKQSWIPLFWGLAAIINIILNILLIPLFGVLGAGIATLSSYLVMFIYIYKKNQTWMPLNFINKFLIFYFILSIIIIGLTNCMVFDHTILLIALIVYSIVGLNHLLSYKKLL